MSGLYAVPSRVDVSEAYPIPEVIGVLAEALSNGATHVAIRFRGSSTVSVSGRSDQ